MQVRHEKEILRENRHFREKQYAERRQKDYEEALAREYALCESAREEYFRACELQLTQHREILAEKAAAKHKRNYQDCEEVVRAIVELSLRIGEYRGLNDRKEVGVKMLREWKLLFLKGMEVGKGYDVELEVDKVAGVPPIKEEEGEKGKEEAVEGIMLLDEKEFEDYLGGTGFWTYPGDA